MITLRGIAELGLGRVVALLEARAARVDRHAAGLRPGSSGWRLAYQSPVHSQTLPAMSRRPSPFGGYEPTGGGGAVARVGPPREVAVPVVGEPLPRALGLVAPGVDGAVEPAPRGVLPLGLGRQRLARPGGVGLGVLVGDVHDRVLGAARERGAGALGVPPAGAGRPRPPLAQVPEVDRARGAA